MERSLRKVAFAGAVLAILGWPARASAADPNKDVRVVNTPAESVPVTVVNPVAAPVHVAGHVTLAGTPSVDVASLPSDPFQKHVANLLLYDTIDLTTGPRREAPRHRVHQCVRGRDRPVRSAHHLHFR